MSVNCFRWHWIWWVPTNDSRGSVGQPGALILTWSACVPSSWPLLISTGRRAFSKSSCALPPRPLLSFLNFSSPEFSSWVWSDLFFHSYMSKPVHKGAGWIHQFWPFLGFSQGSSEKQQGIGLWSCRPETQVGAGASVLRQNFYFLRKLQFSSYGLSTDWMRLMLSRMISFT